MTSPGLTNRVLLIEDRGANPRGSAACPRRRYRLARLRFESRPVPAPAGRFRSLRRATD